MCSLVKHSLHLVIFGKAQLCWGFFLNMQSFHIFNESPAKFFHHVGHVDLLEVVISISMRENTHWQQIFIACCKCI